MLLPRVKWSFSLISYTQDLPFDKFDEALGFTGQIKRNRKDFPLMPPELQMSYWGCYVERCGCTTIEEVFDDLKIQLHPKQKEILRLIADYQLKAQLDCVIEATSGDGPEVILSSESIKFICELGAELDFDLYYSDKEDTGTVLLP